MPLEVRVGCEFVFEAAEASPSVFQVEPHPQFPHAVLQERWDCEPMAARREYVDAFGNRCQRLTIPAGKSTVRYDATVEISDEPDVVRKDAKKVPPEDLPEETLQFLLPSRYVLPDVLAGAAADGFDVGPGWAQVQAICHWVHKHIEYALGSTDSLSDAADVYLQRKGVCRDYAHLAISFCRALYYPARYVAGYIPLLGRPLPEEGMDFSAWIEVYIGGEWYTFDPRNDTRLAGRVLIGRGRDAVDVAMVTSAGTPRLESMKVWTEA
jgi:transglutaminase-like putative cysteine protease